MIRIKKDLNYFTSIMYIPYHKSCDLSSKILKKGGNYSARRAVLSGRNVKGGNEVCKKG